MKKTQKLAVRALKDIGPDSIVIHPNEGFDLGMMTNEYRVSLCTDLAVDQFLGGSDGNVTQARVELRNECPSRTIQLCAKTFERLGMPDYAVILYDGSRLYLHGLPK